MAFESRVGNSNPRYNETQLRRKLEKRVTLLEKTVATLASKLEEGTTAKAEVVELKDLKLKELKALCDNNGIDYTDFGTTKAPYVTALKEKGL